MSERTGSITRNPSKVITEGVPATWWPVINRAFFSLSLAFIILLLAFPIFWMFNKFDIIFVTTRGGPGERTTTAPIHAFEVAFSTTKLGEAAAISVLLFLVLVVGAVVYFVGLNPAQEVRVE